MSPSCSCHVVARRVDPAQQLVRFERGALVSQGGRGASTSSHPRRRVLTCPTGRIPSATVGKIL
jgi:hypothetical protein